MGEGTRRFIELPVLPTRPENGLVPCLECGQCCTYVAVGINAPRTPRYASEILWYLYHDHVYVYRDGDGEWSVHFETRCRNLGPDLKCQIYEQRPHICRGFDNKTCNVNSKEGEALYFRSPQQFVEWLERKHRKVYRRLAERQLPATLKERHRPKARSFRSAGRRRPKSDAAA